MRKQTNWQTLTQSEKEEIIFLSHWFGLDINKLTNDPVMLQHHQKLFEAEIFQIKAVQESVNFYKREAV